MACFETEAQAALAEKRLADGKPLAELKQNLTSVVTLDYWDYQTKLHYDVTATAEKSIFNKNAHCFKTLESGLNVQCWTGDFNVSVLELRRGDKTNVEVTWPPFDERLTFPSNKCQIK